MNGTLQSAAESLENELLRCSSKTEFIKIRNALITSIMIRSVRRAQQFAEFTIGEWKQRTLLEKKQGREDEYIVKIKMHKTSIYGGAEVILSAKEEAALRAYMLYARRFGSDCNNDACPVFACNALPCPAECCIKLDLSNVAKIVRKTALKAGVATNSVNTRVLRRSTISTAWRKKSDPSFRQELSQLAGHSYETGRRYYAVFGQEEQSRRVVARLEEYRR